LLSKKSKNLFRPYLLTICLIIVAFILTGGSSELNVNEKHYAIINNNKIYLALADTPRKRTKGLMYIKHLPKHYGMIFLFKDSKQRTFWMKNVKIPLDIIFSRKNKIVNIAKNASIDTSNKSKLYKSYYKADCVIEVNAGFTDKYDVKVGNFIKLSPDLKYKWMEIQQ